VDQKYDVIVLGAGAAGLMCAIEAGKRGRRVLVLERADRIGKKILISGGGRCNFTNLHTSPENFFSANRHFAKSALARLHSDRLRGPCRKARHFLSREKAWSVVLRSSGERHHRDA